MKRTKRALKLAFIPHKKNSYRPHFIRRYGLVAIIFVVAGLQLGYNAAKTGNFLGVESDITVTSLFSQTNVARLDVGKPTLKLNEKLNHAAYLKAQHMFSGQYWSHVAPDGTKPWKWFGDVGYNYDEAGENLAKNFTSANAVMTAWLNSPEHKENIMKSSYQDVGFAVVTGELNGDPTTLVVALYGVPAEGDIAGVNTLFTEATPTNQVNILTQFAIATQSLTPAVIGGLTMMAFAVLVAALAHAYRRKLPKSLRKSWYRHHAIYKTAILLSFGLVMIFMYGGGQI